MEPLAERSGRSTPAEPRSVESPDGTTLLGGRRFSRMSVGSAEAYAARRTSASAASVASRASSGGMPSARQRRKSATDAVGSYPIERVTHFAARSSDEEDAALARASTALLHARFQAAVATQLNYNDLVREPVPASHWRQRRPSAGPSLHWPPPPLTDARAQPTGAYFLYAAASLRGPSRWLKLAAALLLCGSGIHARRTGEALRSARGALDARAAAASRAFILAVALTCLGQVAVTLAQLVGLAAAPDRHAPHSPDPAGVATAYLGTLHAASALRWVRTQLPPRAVILPEAVRGAAALLAALAYVARQQPGGLQPACALALVWRAAATAVATPFAVAAFHERQVVMAHLPPELLACPRALAPVVETLARAAHRFAAAMGPGPLLDTPALNAIAACVAAFAALEPVAAPRAMPALVRRGCAALAVAVAAHASARRRAGNAVRLTLLQQRLGITAAADERGEATSPAPSSPDTDEYDAAAALARRLALASDEHAAVRAALEELYRRFPRAAVCAVATLRPGDAGTTRYLEAAAARECDRRALLDELVAPVPRSAARAVCARCGPRIASSADWPGASAAFADWAAVTAAGVAPGGMYVTARLPCATGASLGFAVLVFEAQSAPSPAEAHLQRALLAFASAVGAALGARRASDALAEQARQLTASHRLVSHMFPQHVAQRLEQRRRSAVSLAPVSPDREPRRSTPRVSFAPDVAGGVADETESSDDDGFDANMMGIDYDAAGGDSCDTMVTRHESVTVVYADVAGFQALAAQLPPEASLRLLDALWQRFDTLAAMHALFKVETSDDSYTAVAGLSPPRADHARAALRFALDLHAAAAEASVPLPGRAGAGLLLRVGVHTGTAASGVLGATRPRFALAGDAVSVARHAEAFDAGAVHLTRAAADACGIPPSMLPEREQESSGLAWCVLQAGSLQAETVRKLLNEVEAPAHAPLPDIDSEKSYSSDREETPTPAWSEEDEGGPAPEGEAQLRTTPQRSGFLAGRRSISPQPRVSRPHHIRHSINETLQPGRESPRNSLALEPQDDDEEEDSSPAVLEQQRLRMRCGRFMYAHLSASAFVPLAYLLYLAGARATLTVLACVAATVFVSRRSRRLNVSESAFYTPRVLTAALWLMAAVHTTCLVLLVRAASSDANMYLSLALGSSVNPVYIIQWVLSGVPARLLWLPELLESVVHAVAIMHNEPTLGDTFFKAAALVLKLFCGTIIKLLVLPLLYIPTDAMVELLAEVETWPQRPAALRCARDACIGAVIRARNTLLGGAPLMGPHGMAILALHNALCLVHLFTSDDDLAPLIVTSIRSVRVSFLLVCAGGAVVSFRSNAASALLRQQDDSESAVTTRVLATLRSRIAVARSETAILEAATEALNTLFPHTAAVAAGTFVEGSGCGMLAALQVTASTRGARQALSVALPLAVGSNARSSVSRACAGLPGERPLLLDSRALRGGVGACGDWSAASEAGLPTARAITAPLTAGALVVGFVQLHFGLYSPHSSRPVDGALARLCDKIGGAIFVRRAFAVNREAAVGTVDAVLPPPRRVPSLSKLNLSFRGGKPVDDDVDSDGVSGDEDDDDERAEAGGIETGYESPSRSGAGSPGPYPTSAADAAALAELDAAADTDRAMLLNWALDPAALSDDELRRLTVAQFHALGLLRRFRLSPTALRAFVDDVASHMNDVPFRERPCCCACLRVVLLTRLAQTISGMRLQ